MNRLSKIFLGLLLCCTVLVSCGDWELRRQMKSFMAQVITLPSELQEIKCGSISPVTITMSNSTMVFFYGNDECSSCAIDHLKDDLLGFVDIEQSGKCKVVVLFSLSEDDQLDVQDQIRELKFPFPVYVDLYGDFYRINKDFPSDRRFHSFLLGNDAHPVFVGNPLHGKKLYKVFEKVLKINKTLMYKNEKDFIYTYRIGVNSDIV